MAVRAAPHPVKSSDFNALYDEHVDPLWRVVTRLGVPAEGIEDVVQEVFVVAFQKLPQFERRSTVRTWLTGIAIRVASAWRRKHSRGGEPVSEDVVDHAPGPEAAHEAASRVRALQRVLNCLDPERREVFVLFELEELTAPEIAAATGINVNTVYSRLRLAREDFERALSRAAGEIR